MKKILRKSEVAALLDVTVAAVNKMISERRIPYVKATATRGGSVRFDEDEIMSFIRKNSVPAEATAVGTSTAGEP